MWSCSSMVGLPVSTPPSCWDMFTNVFLQHFKLGWRKNLSVSDEEEEFVQELSSLMELTCASTRSFEVEFSIFQDPVVDRIHVVSDQRVFNSSLIMKQTHFHLPSLVISPTCTEIAIIIPIIIPHCNGSDFHNNVNFIIPPKPSDPNFDIGNNVNWNLKLTCLLIHFPTKMTKHSHRWSHLQRCFPINLRYWTHLQQCFSINLWYRHHL